MVTGLASEGTHGGVYPCTVSSVSKDTVAVQVLGEGTAGGVKALAGLPRSGAPVNSKEVAKEGDGHALVLPREKDDEYPKQGCAHQLRPNSMLTPHCRYDDLTRMRALNDAELCRNLRTLYGRQQCYSRCGATLVALNLMQALHRTLCWLLRVTLTSQATPGMFSHDIAKS